ncbi:hypothetical protein CRYUN_Cryun34aG0086100 [Craigia yunnanensis]
MPKDRRVRSLSFDRSMGSLYPCSSRDAKQCQPEKLLGLDLDQPRMLKSGRMQGALSAWNTRTMHYFCGVLPLRRAVSLSCAIQVTAIQILFDQFCYYKILVSSLFASRSRRDPLSFCDQTEASSDLQPKFLCPLCRGEIYGWSVVEPSREFMNSKARNCSSETCDYSGTYNELRKHARSDHPLVRPTERDPKRQHDWTRLERERDYEDLLSSVQPVAGEESNGENISDLEEFSWLTLNLAYLTLALEVISDSRNREQARRRSRGRRFRCDRESDHGIREYSSSVSNIAFLGQWNNPSSVERFQGR